MAICTGCEEEKPQADFPIDSRSGRSRPRCKECIRAYSKAHYEKNREKRSRQAAEWYAANKERRNEQQRQWYRENAEAQAEYQRRYNAERPGLRARLVREWREANPERDAELRRAWAAANRDRLRELGRRAYAADPIRFIESSHRRRALIAKVSVGPVDYERLWTGFCGICSGPMDRDLAYPDPMSKSVDHIIPLARGGSHEHSNLQWAHLRCNIGKGARLPDPEGEVA